MNDSTASVERPQTRRTEYRDGGVLSAAALAGDSATNIAARENHQATAHTGGIVAGLVVTIQADGVHVSPGAAIDSLGRMLLVRSAFPPGKLPSVGKCFAVCLRHAIVEEPAVVSELNRYSESPQLDLPVLDDPESPCEDVESRGVLLAIVRPAVKNSFKLRVDGCRRRYVGAVGSQIQAPSGRARVVLGPQFARDSRRFAIGVQPSPREAMQDVFTWEATGTIRLSAPSSVATPHEKQEPGRVEQPPITVIGSPTVRVAPEDILDPCEIWEQLHANDDGKRRIQTAILKVLPSCDRRDFQSPPECRVRLTLLLVRVLNCLIRNMADSVLDASRAAARTNAGFVPAIAGDEILDAGGNRLTVTGIDLSQKTYQLSGMTNPVGWLEVQPLDRYPAFLTGGKPSDQLIRWLPHWNSLPGDFMCRLLLDSFLKGTLRPFNLPRPRGLFFSGSAPADPEPSASRIHLVEFKKDGETFRQLRITIQDPGKENSPHRYRCSIGTAEDCTHPPAPISVPEGNIWNRQTSLPRGILSVLADKSIDIHKGLNVWAREHTIDAGLILKLAPAGAGGGASTGAGGTTGLPLPTTPILDNAVLWDGQRVRRRSPGSIEIGGSLHNLTDVMIESIQILVTIYGKNDTTHEPIHKPVITAATLDAQMTKPISSLVTSPDLVVTFGDPFASGPIIVSLLVMGANQHNVIVCTQYREELP